jgi:hypothetical protein
MSTTSLRSEIEDFLYREASLWMVGNSTIGWVCSRQTPSTACRRRMRRIRIPIARCI